MGYKTGMKMGIDEDLMDKVTTLKPAIFKAGLFANLRKVDDKDTMKWILVKFLKESLDYLADPDNKEKLKGMKRGTLIEEWIDSNLNFGGKYDNEK